MSDMIPGTEWQRVTPGNADLDALRDVAYRVFSEHRRRVSIKPTQVEIDHALAKIRAWRDYLPAACVAAMIKDGWQWST